MYFDNLVSEKSSTHNMRVRTVFLIWLSWGAMYSNYMFLVYVSSTDVTGSKEDMMTLIKVNTLHWGSLSSSQRP